MTPRCQVVAKGRRIVALLIILLAASARGALAQTTPSNSTSTASAHDRLIQLYTSTTTPPHYARAIQSLLQSHAPVQASTGMPLGVDSVSPLAVSDLSGVRVYPNPYKPNGGDSNHGVAFNPSNPSSGIIFDTLTPSATIKIYTASGQLVRTLGPPNGSGAIQWDVLNDNGRDVATGLYLAIITSPGVSKSVKKVVIVR